MWLEIGSELLSTTLTASGGKHNVRFSIGFKWALGGERDLLVLAGRSLRGDPDMALFVSLTIFTPLWE